MKAAKVNTPKKSAASPVPAPTTSGKKLDVPQTSVGQEIEPEVCCFSQQLIDFPLKLNLKYIFLS